MPCDGECGRINGDIGNFLTRFCVANVNDQILTGWCQQLSIVTERNGAYRPIESWEHSLETETTNQSKRIRSVCALPHLPNRPILRHPTVRREHRPNRWQNIFPLDQIQCKCMCPDVLSAYAAVPNLDSWEYARNPGHLSRRINHFCCSTQFHSLRNWIALRRGFYAFAYRWMWPNPLYCPQQSYCHLVTMWCWYFHLLYWLSLHFCRHVCPKCEPFYHRWPYLADRAMLRANTIDRQIQCVHGMLYLLPTKYMEIRLVTIIAWLGA